MWIFAQKGFLSIVRSDKPGVLVVRSRFRGHIERLFPKTQVMEDATKDYRFRVELSIEKVSRVMARMVLEINYDNFKDSLDADDEQYLDCCLNVYHSVARNSGDWDFNYSDYLRGELNEG